MNKARKSRKAVKRSMVHLAIAAVSVAGNAGIAKAQTRPAVPASTSAAAVSSNGKSWNERANDGRFQDSIDAFVASDREHAPPEGGVLFVGSSTIRFWETLGEQFNDLPIVRRGFGGSRMADCTHYLDALVTPHKPKMVVVYAGDNDLNEGATPQDVLKSFEDFVTGVRKKLPDTRIAYVSIKPSPSRAKNIEASLETNKLIEDYTHTMPNLDYIDTYSAMLDADGKPRMELFRGDALHMNPKGYALWQKILAPHLVLKQVPVVAKAAVDRVAAAARDESELAVASQQLAVVP